MCATDPNRQGVMRLADERRYQCPPKGDGKRAGQWDDQNRQYRHARNAHGGVDSFCLRCERAVASADDEWLLLDYEKHHVCSM